MNYMLCIYGRAEENKLIAFANRANIGIELQSYGLNGVSSAENWQRKIATHINLRKKIYGKVAVHGPFIGIEYNHKDHILRQAVEKRMDITFKMVSQIKADTLVLHTGYDSLKKIFKLEEHWLETVSNFWLNEIKRYADLGITVVLENLIESEPKLMNELINRVNNKYLRLCLDVGHANVASKIKPYKWVEVMGKNLMHVHIHDNNGATDSHLPVGQGNIDFARLIAAIKSNAPNTTLSMEVEAKQDLILSSLKKVMRLADSGC